MSIINGFLGKSALTSAVVAMILTTLSTTPVSAQVNSRVVGNNNNVVINNHRGGGRGGYYRHRGYRVGNKGGAILAGVVGGALLMSAISNSRSSRYDYHYYDRPRYRTSVGVHYGYGHRGYGYRPRTRVVYVERPVQTVVHEVPVYQQPAQPYYNQQPQPQQQYQNSSCLQTREYQTYVEVGGRTVPAYGQACLQPDGSWMHGEPITAPSF